MCIGGTPKPPPIPEVPTPPILPTRDDPAVNADASAKRKRLLARQGQKSNILTSSLGATDDANVGQASLLG